MNTYSILIPVYNTPINKLKRALDSCIQFKDSSEIMIYDDGSTKVKTYEKLIEKFSDLKINYNRSDKNHGILQARRYMTSNKSCISNYTIFLDSDDEFKPNAREIIDNTINKNPGHKIYFFEDDLLPEGELNMKNAHTYKNTFICNSCYMPPYVTGRVYESFYIYDLLETQFDDNDYISLGEDSLITYVMFRSICKWNTVTGYVVHNNFYQRNDSTMSKLFKPGCSFSQIETAYKRDSYHIELFIKSYIERFHYTINELEIEWLFSFAIRISIGRFIQCDYFYKIIDLLVDDYGWQRVIDCFKNDQNLKPFLKEYFNKL